MPWPTFAAPGRSKRTPMGPDQLSRGPPGRPLERKTHLWRPSLSLPGKPIGLSLKKTFVFEKIVKTTINVGSGASWEKRAALQNRVFGFWALPGALQSPGPFVQDPPRSSPKRLWSSQGHPKFSQERPEAPKGHIKSTKLACLKP